MRRRRLSRRAWPEQMRCTAAFSIGWMAPGFLGAGVGAAMAAELCGWLATRELATQAAGRRRCQVARRLLGEAFCSRPLFTFSSPSSARSRSCLCCSDAQPQNSCPISVSRSRHALGCSLSTRAGVNCSDRGSLHSNHASPAGPWPPQSPVATIIGSLASERKVSLAFCATWVRSREQASSPACPSSSARLNGALTLEDGIGDCAASLGRDGRPAIAVYARWARAAAAAAPVAGRKGS